VNSDFCVSGRRKEEILRQRGRSATAPDAYRMHSNGTALVIGMASFPKAPLVTVPAAIYIIFQHLLASLVKARLAARDR